jgi:hypothetical protein
MAKRDYTEAQGHQSEPGGQDRRTMRLVLSSFVLAALLVAAGGSMVNSERRKCSLVFTQMPCQSERPAGFQFRNSPPKGSRVVLLSPEGTLTVLTAEFFAAAEPDVRFDGKRILFSGKRSPKDSWNIWEMDPDGKNKKQVTEHFGDCREPKYLATSSITAPEFEDKVRWITFTSNAANTYDELGPDLSTALYARNLEPIQGRGLITRRSTFNLSSDFSPTVLQDGRILFTSRQNGDLQRYPHGRFLLLASNWDGTVLNLFCGSGQGATLKTMACEMPDRTLVFVESEGENPDGSGRIARVSFKRPLHSYQLLSKEGGWFRNPAPLPGGGLLVSYRAGKEAYGLYAFDSSKGQLGEKIYQDPKWESVEAIPLAVRSEPQGLISSVVDSESTADLQCLNVYDSDQPEAADIKTGEVKRVRVVEGVPISKQRAGETIPRMLSLPWSRTRILGEAPVEPDGSFLAKVPGDTPLYIQTLNEEGMALMTLPSWIWVRRGTSRGCIGCHENKELAPENRTTEALIKLKQTALLGPPEQRRRVSFREAVLPIIEARCASCHTGKTPAGHLELTSTPTKQANKAYEHLMAGRYAGAADVEDPYVVPGSARKSRLIQVLFGRPTIPGSGHPAVLKEEEKKTIVEWIDLGARWEN